MILILRLGLRWRGFLTVTDTHLDQDNVTAELQENGQQETRIKLMCREKEKWRPGSPWKDCLDSSYFFLVPDGFPFSSSSLFSTFAFYTNLWILEIHSRLEMVSLVIDSKRKCGIGRGPHHDYKHSFCTGPAAGSLWKHIGKIWECACKSQMPWVYETRKTNSNPGFLHRMWRKLGPIRRDG